MQYSVFHEGEVKEKKGKKPVFRRESKSCMIFREPWSTVEDSDNGVPRSWYTEFYLFSYFFAELIICHLSFSVSLVYFKGTYKTIVSANIYRDLAIVFGLNYNKCVKLEMSYISCPLNIELSYCSTGKNN